MLLFLHENLQTLQFCVQFLKFSLLLYFGPCSTSLHLLVIYPLNISIYCNKNIDMVKHNIVPALMYMHEQQPSQSCTEYFSWIPGSQSANSKLATHKSDLEHSCNHNKLQTAADQCHVHVPVQQRNYSIHKQSINHIYTRCYTSHPLHRMHFNQY